MSGKALRIALILAALTLAACAPAKAPPPVFYPPVDERLPVEKGALMNSVAFHGIRSMRAVTRARLFRDGERLVKLSGIMLFRPPETMFLRLFSVLGTRKADLLWRDGRMNIYVPEDRTVYVADVPRMAIAEGAHAAIRNAPEGYRLDVYEPAIQTSGPVLSYTFDPLTLLNTGAFASTPAGTLLAEFSDYRKDIPNNIRLTHSSGFALQLIFNEVEPDVELPDSFFQMKSDDAEVKPLVTMPLPEAGPE